MSYRLILGDWERHKTDARAVRYDVFVIEQNVPVELEWDDMDAACVHAVVYDDAGQAVATGRLLPDGHIGRMAVRKSARGQGIGGLVLQALMEEAQRRGDRCVLLNAQTQAEPFYRRFGFVRDGEEFIEAGIAHVSMRRDFGTTST
ncbi:GNAT family N-acetyltransferase [Noviherbaspirillum sp. UKPF54]|uniref:GNAT family N-acetyltransferase n=1 Tax=Noviherbaspirillum sp. UKPF54 TaxID=2601898 RepID=UPI0011B12FDF|nr:GNAT family N-acetyltransferase [Noviherbaspirillum sp. UKPF54]QDZ27647.1 GNAT family N-acetyltransferase [Noviherbaspirillum sp. UKPF54]